MILLRSTYKVNLNANLPQTFNNLLGFEPGLWWRKSGWFEGVSKRSVFELSP